ncbi:MAG: bifunctional indole-3-glycerol-phosphate synthase TrpC/phosphoribosylanthranilate isomerase TrpF [Myxococcales bacterium]|nr:bifunctional indole-3-glycerol-phosphate synthase TrpC/phosphoribosylanthranilate isomerase TrpF [Myxococcales bacterium]
MSEARLEPRALPDVLVRIIGDTRRGLALRVQERPLDDLRARATRSERSLVDAIRERPVGLILECKAASPSQGRLRESYDPVAIARAYADVASGISVLCERDHFGGSLDHLAAVRQAGIDLPLLCKDFIVDPYQIYEARIAGADAVLLMCSVLDQDELRRCYAVASALGMDALVEVHDANEMARAADIGAQLIGINNRDLRTLDVSLSTTERLAALAPSSATLISESGISGRADLRRLRPLVDGFLVGSSLMRRADLEHAARELAYGRVKVCGLTRPEDALQAWRHGASWGGVILAAESPRAVSVERAAEICRSAPLHWAAVFVNHPPAEVARIVEHLGLSAVQLHGEENTSYVRELAKQLGPRCEVWKAVRVRERLSESADAIGATRLLFDAYHPEQRGGTGATFDWTNVSGRDDFSASILAGGLGPANVADAEALGPWAVDLNSGLESKPGVKSPQRVVEAFEQLRGGSNRRVRSKGS